MVQQMSLGEVSIDVVFKDIKNVHLSVYPPTGRVRVSAPSHMTLDTVRLFAISKIGWIKKHQRKQRAQERETPREYIERESHYLWGRRYLLRICAAETRSEVKLGSRTIELHVPPSTSPAGKREVLDEWYRGELRRHATPLLLKWRERLDVELSRFFVQRMRTKWGSSNPSNRTIRLNLDLARLPLDCLDYIALHELAHFVVPNHNSHFKALLDKNMPGWRAVRDRLNEGPLAAYDYDSSSIGLAQSGSS